MVVKTEQNLSQQFPVNSVVQIQQCSNSDYIQVSSNTNWRQNSFTLSSEDMCASWHAGKLHATSLDPSRFSTSSQVSQSFLQPLCHPCEGWPAGEFIQSLFFCKTSFVELDFKLASYTYLRFASCLQQAAAIWEYQGGVFAGKRGLRPSETTPNMTCILLIPVYAGSPIKASHTASK